MRVESTSGQSRWIRRGDRGGGNDANVSASSTLGAMDTPVAKPPLWRRYGPLSVLAVLVLGFGIYLLAGARSHVYRVPIDRVTLGTVTQGPFEDFIAVRRATLSLLRNLDEPAWTRRGTANKNEVTVRALAYITAGHELHHRRILEEKYFAGAGRDAGEDGGVGGC